MIAMMMKVAVMVVVVMMMMLNHDAESVPLKSHCSVELTGCVAVVDFDDYDDDDDVDNDEMEYADDLSVYYVDYFDHSIDN